jgi:hypothetical protein
MSTPLKFGHWIQVGETGGMHAVDTEGNTIPVVMERDAFVPVVIKSGAARVAVRLIHLQSRIRKIEAAGDYVREVFVMRTGE